MANFERNLRQTCTYWEQTGTDIQGAPTFKPPSVLSCRWEDVTELFLNKRGQEVTSKSRVFLATDVSLEGYLYLGSSNAADPRSLSGASEIQMVKRTPDLRAIKTLYVAML